MTASPFDYVTCRRCGVPMQKGRIYSARWIKWLDPGDTAPIALGQLGDETLVGVGIGMRPKTTVAHRCRTCRVVEFDY